jgi:hypothetical protein
MGRFTAAGERGTFAFRVGRPRLLETDYRSTFNSGCMTPTSEQVQLTSETDTSDVSFRRRLHSLQAFRG